jgi:hypothetical protein
VAVAGAATGVAIADVSGPDLSAPSPAGTASSAPAELASAFSAIAAPRKPADILPPEAATSFTEPGSFGTHYGVNVDLSRLMGVANGTSVWLVPGSTGSCILVSSGGSVCGSNESASAEGMFLAIVPANGGAAPWVIGIVPDGAHIETRTAAGTQAPAASVGGNAYFISGADGTQSFTVVTRSGASYTYELPDGTPPPRPEAGTPSP